MASVWFSVLVLIFTQQVLADNDDGVIQTCDQCIRIGSLWCSDPKTTQCESRTQRRDDWCLEMGPEVLNSVAEVSLPKGSDSPEHIERSINIGNPDYINIVYQSNEIKDVFFNVMNPTQNKDAVDVVKVSNNCNGKRCKTSIKVTVENDFCTPNGTNLEYFYMEILVGNIMKTSVKYHVPCACECSLRVQKNSFWCHRHGDFVCGVCVCHDEWTGRFCNQVKDVGHCKDRGDIPSSDSSYLDNGMNCSGNGYFGPCDNCVCYEDRRGSQYFHQESRCGGICQITSNCDSCIKNAIVGSCGNDCPFPITIQTLNKTLLENKDIFDRKIWVHCNVTVENCNMKYMAMSTEDDRMFLMVEPCEPDAAPLMSEQVSLALGIFALILLVTAVAGMVMWKHLRSVPPMPSTDMEYHNIDAEDCTGVNPLYIDPCSSFKNPMYGK